MLQRRGQDQTVAHADEGRPRFDLCFRGPILRCSRGNLRAEVKRVVWHEVAHWLGYETEEQVQALGL